MSRSEELSEILGDAWQEFREKCEHAHTDGLSICMELCGQGCKISDCPNLAEALDE